MPPCWCVGGRCRTRCCLGAPAPARHLELPIPPAPPSGSPEYSVRPGQFRDSRASEVDLAVRVSTDLPVKAFTYSVTLGPAPVDDEAIGAGYREPSDG